MSEGGAFFHNLKYVSLPLFFFLLPSPFLGTYLPFFGILEGSLAKQVWRKEYTEGQQQEVDLLAEHLLWAATAA